MRIMRRVFAFYCAIVWATALPLQMAFASFNSIPKAWWGSFRTTANTRYIMTISSQGQAVNFIGYCPNEGDIAASKPESIYFNPALTGTYENVSIRFSSYSTYNSATGKYESQRGTATLIANCNSQNTDILVLTGDKGYGDEKSVDRYKKFA